MILRPLRLMTTMSFQRSSRSKRMLRKQKQDRLRKTYSDIRAIVPVFVEDTPFYEEIAQVEEYLRSNPLKLK